MRIEKIRKVLDRIMCNTCVLLFVAMILVGSYQIATRYFFDRPSTVSEDLLTYSFTWLSLLAAAYVFGRREHMRMGFLVDRLPERWRHYLEIGMEVLIMIFVAVVMVYGGIFIVRLTMSQMTASLGIPMGIVYLAVPLSGITIVLYNLLNILEIIKKMRRAERRGSVEPGGSV